MSIESLDKNPAGFSGGIFETHWTESLVGTEILLEKLLDNCLKELQEHFVDAMLEKFLDKFVEESNHKSLV